MQFFLAILIAALPGVLKRAVYRYCFGYRIGRNVRIGFSPFVRVKHCVIDDDVSIGHLNLFCDVGEVVLAAGCRIGQLNLFRGGTRIRLGLYASVQRLNVLNAIRNAEVVNPHSSECEIGAGAVLTQGHWLDFTDRISIGHNVIIGGRNCSLWTHSRQRTRPITIEHHSYLGSEVKVAPGVHLGPMCVASIGSVLLGDYPQPAVLLAGNPAAVRRPLLQTDWPLVSRKNRADIPDTIAYRDLTPELMRAGARAELALVAEPLHVPDA